MGGSKSKEVVQHVEKSARNVISKQKPVDFSGSIGGNIYSLTNYLYSFIQSQLFEHIFNI